MAKKRGRGVAGSWYGIARTATVDRAGTWVELDDGGTALPRTAGCRRFAVRCAPASRPGSTRTTTALHERENVLSDWLQRASYETGFVGKHMNK